MYYCTLNIICYFREREKPSGNGSGLENGVTPGLAVSSSYFSLTIFICINIIWLGVIIYSHLLGSTSWIQFHFNILLYLLCQFFANINPCFHQETENHALDNVAVNVSKPISNYLSDTGLVECLVERLVKAINTITFLMYRGTFAY